MGTAAVTETEPNWRLERRRQAQRELLSQREAMCLRLCRAVCSLSEFFHHAETSRCVVRPGNRCRNAPRRKKAILMRLLAVDLDANPSRFHVGVGENLTLNGGSASRWFRFCSV